MTATFQSGDRLGHFSINGCFVTPDILPDATTWLAARRCPGDHRFAILDFCMDVLVGDNTFRVVWPEVWCLTCSIPQTATQYIALLTGFLLAHQFLLSVHNLYKECWGHFTPKQA